MVRTGCAHRFRTGGASLLGAGIAPIFVEKFTGVKRRTVGRILLTPPWSRISPRLHIAVGVEHNSPATRIFFSDGFRRRSLTAALPETPHPTRASNCIK